MTLDICTMETPVGPLRLMAWREKLVACEFVTTPDRLEAALARVHKHIGNLEPREHHDPAGSVGRLTRYFGGELHAIDDQPCEPHGTEFQLAVWAALRKIRAGTTWTYSRLAEHIGRPAAARAVGAANGANSIALFLPCHRVIAADHTLWGYGGGLHNKRWLLTHEGAAFADKHAQVAMEL